MRSYRWWQRILGERFFGLDQEGRPVLFFVDDDVAKGLHREAPSEQRIGDLCASVAQEAIDWQRDAFHWVEDEVADWKRQREHERPPPCLPLLAVCVLAATHMKGTGKRGAPRYYEHLAELLRPMKMTVEDVDRHLRSGYSVVPEFWRELERWLETREHRNGVSTLRFSKGRERIGYAQSQAIMCAADQDRLAAFFKDHRGESGQELLKNIRRWKERSHLSRALREALDSGEQDDILAALLFSLSAAVGDETPIRQGSRRLRLRVGAEDDRQRGWVLRWRAARVPGVDNDMLMHKEGALRVTASEDLKYYSMSGDIPDMAAALGDGLSATGARLAIGMSERTRILVLQQDPAGGWTETDRPEPCQPSLIVYSEATKREAGALLDKAGYEWDEGEETTAPGWYVLDDIEFEASGTLRKRALRFKGGLHVWQKHERHHFMMGGEPDLFPPLDADIVKLDGVPISTGGRPIRLRGRGLDAREHTVELDRHRLTFFTHAPQRPEGMASPSVENARLCEKLRAVIDADGRFTRLRPPVTPLWWRTRNTGLAGTTWRPNIPESAIWLVIEDSHGRVKVQLLRPEEPRINRMTSAMKEFWSQMFLVRPRSADHDLWNKYIKMALKTSMYDG